MPASPPTDPEAGSAEWLALSDDLLAGLVHALNNRVTALSVFAELTTLGDNQMASSGMLATEVARLQRLSTLLAMLPARRQAAEALEIDPVLDDAIALHAQHPRIRAIECVVERKGELPPLRAARWALLRLLLLVVHAAKGAAETAHGERVTLHLIGDANSLTLRVFALDSAGVHAQALAARCGGALEQVGDDLQLTLPSLAEMRRREQLVRAAD
jgi:hypothetical protein